MTSNKNESKSKVNNILKDQGESNKGQEQGYVSDEVGDKGTDDELLAGRDKIKELIKVQEKVLQDTELALKTPKPKSYAKVTSSEGKSNYNGPDPEDLQENTEILKEAIQRNRVELIKARNEVDTILTQRAKLRTFKKSIKQKPVQLFSKTAGPIVLGSPVTRKVKGRKSQESSCRESMAFTNLRVVQIGNKLGGKFFAAPCEDEDGEFAKQVLAETNKAKKQIAESNTSQVICIGNQKLTLKATAGLSLFQPMRRYNREERKEMTSMEEREAFWKSLTGYVLPKDNKLEPIAVKVTDAKLLLLVKNLNAQLKALEDHLYAHDCLETFTIVQPLDVEKSSQALPQTLNLMEDFALLHPQTIANSNTWYHVWVANKELIAQNMLAIIELLRKNTDPKLFMKAQEDHDEYLPVQHGGALLFKLIMTRVLDVGEATIEFLTKRIQHLKVTDFTGENVEDLIGLFKAARQILQQVSTKERSHVPEDIKEIALAMFQTFSFEESNIVFAHKMRLACHAADKYGGVPKYPSVSKTCTLALNTYRCLTSPGGDYRWVTPTIGNGAFTISCQPIVRCCFNCGSESCPGPSKCTVPVDQARVKRNRDAYFKHKEAANTSGGQEESVKRQKRDKRGKGKPRTDKMGQPLTNNKNGVFVVDTKKMNAQRTTEQAKEDKKALQADVVKHVSNLEKKAKALNVSTSSSSSQSDTNNTSTATTPAVFSTEAHELKELLNKAFN